MPPLRSCPPQVQAVTAKLESQAAAKAAAAAAEAQARSRADSRATAKLKDAQVPMPVPVQHAPWMLCSDFKFQHSRGGI